MGLACKAAIMPMWFEDGYTLSDEGEDLVLAILDELRLLACNGNPNGLVRLPGGDMRSVAIS